MEKSTDQAKVPDTGPRAPRASYWRRNLTRLVLLLSVWFVGSFGAAIVFVDELDRFSFFGFPFGFWFAQQGSIFLFLALILAYVWTMNALDDEHESDGQEDDASEEGAA